MIQYAPDGVTLIGHAADGSEFRHSTHDGALYDNMLDVRNAQKQADRDNAKARSDYETNLANAQVNVDAGRPMPAPIKPLMKVIADTGGAPTMVPFVPALADLKVPVVLPPSAPGVGGITRDLSQDTKIASMYSMISAMFHKMFPGA